MVGHIINTRVDSVRISGHNRGMEQSRSNGDGNSSSAKTAGKKNVYGPEDVDDINFDLDIVRPGVPPYRRGIYPQGFAEHSWTKKLISGYGTPESTRARQDVLLAAGQGSWDAIPLHLVVDIPTANGMDSDDPLAVDDVGLCGVAMDSIDDMDPLLSGLPLDKLNTTFILSGAAPMLLGMYIAYMTSHGIDEKELRGQVWNNPLSEYISSMYPPISPDASLRMMTDTIEYCARNVPKFRAVNLDGYNVREAGSTAVQEVAFVIAEGIELIRETVKRGVSAEAAAQTLTFTWASHSDFFEEIAKFRAAREVWSRSLSRLFDIHDARSLRMKANVQTAGSTLTAAKPLGNVARVALEALAAVLGGCQSLHTSSYDEALGIPTEHAVTIALETQRIIQVESGVEEVTDPLGGSWYLERLTSDMVDKITAEVERIEEGGGFLALIKSGQLQQEISAEAWRTYQARQALLSRDQVEADDDEVVIEEEQPTVFRVTKEDQEHQIQRVQQTRRDRDPGEWERALKEIERAALANENLMPAFIQGAKARATVGEMIGVIRSSLGDSTFVSVIAGV